MTNVCFDSRLSSVFNGAKGADNFFDVIFDFLSRRTNFFTERTYEEAFYLLLVSFRKQLEAEEKRREEEKIEKERRERLEREAVQDFEYILKCCAEGKEKGIEAAEAAIQEADEAERSTAVETHFSKISKMISERRNLSRNLKEEANGSYRSLEIKWDAQKKKMIEEAKLKKTEEAEAEKAKKVHFQKLPYGIQLNILGKYTYDQISTFENCSDYSKSIRQRQNQAVFPVKVTQLHVFDDFINFWYQKRFTTEVIFSDVTLDDDFCFLLMKHIQKCRKLRLPKVTCSYEDFTAMLKKLEVKDLFVRFIYMNKFPYDTSSVTKFVVGQSYNLPLKHLFSINAKKVFSTTDCTASLILQEMKNFILSSSISTKRKTANYFIRDFTKEEIEEAIEELGVEKSLDWQCAKSAYWSLKISPNKEAKVYVKSRLLKIVF